jgi:ABC-type Mn2+/Zn2+ transport system permease subunit
MSLLALYFWNILAGTSGSLALNLMGVQASARRNSLQILFLSQVAVLGTLLGIWLQSSFLLSAALTSPIAIVFSFAVGTLAQRIIQRLGFPELYYVTLFVLVMSITYMTSALVPELESHMSQAYFGDLATLSNGDCQLMIPIAFLMVTLHVKYLRPITGVNFRLVILDQTARFRTSKMVTAIGVLGILFICISVQTLGFLFTVGMMLIPTSIIRLHGEAGLSSHVKRTSLIACVSVLVGFVASLNLPSAPTVPLILLITLAASLITVLLLRIGHKTDIKTNP